MLMGRFTLDLVFARAGTGTGCGERGLALLRGLWECV